MYYILVAGHVQELCISGEVLGLERVKWKLMSQLQIELGTQLVITVVVDVCICITCSYMFVLQNICIICNKAYDRICPSGHCLCRGIIYKIS